MAKTALATRIAQDIKQKGAITLADYMHRALADPDDGYYIRQQPFGGQGDFTTAPEISQLFGEMLAAWLMDLWQRMGQPTPFCLVELGAGRGTLMADILRSTHIMPAFTKAAQIHFIEISPALCAIQKTQIAPYSDNAFWHNTLESADLPPYPILFIANEFFDALPIHQFHFIENRWHELMIDNKDDDLIFTKTPTHKITTPPQHSPIIEQCPQAESCLTHLTQHIHEHNGAGLIIDYGYHKNTGDSFQAVQDHETIELEAALNLAGAVDLTAHVNFSALENIAHTHNIRTAYTTQGAFLENLGIKIRAHNLTTTSPEKAENITSEYHRLTHEDEMGQLFKVLAVAHPDCPPLAGF